MHDIQPQERSNPKLNLGLSTASQSRAVASTASPIRILDDLAYLVPGLSRRARSCVGLAQARRVKGRSEIRGRQAHLPELARAAKRRHRPAHNDQ